MRVLFITPRYYPFVGGVEHVVKSIAERLKDSTVLCGDPNIKKIEIEQFGGVEVIKCPVFCPFDSYHIPKKIGEIKETLKKISREIDIVHVHSAHSVFSVYCGTLIKKINKDLDVVFTPHYIGIRGGFNKLLWSLWKQKLSQLLRVSKKIQLLSPTEKDNFSSIFPFTEKKLVIIPNGVEKDVFNYKNKGDSNYLLFSGRIEKYKGIDILPKLGEILNVDVLLIGRGSYIKKLKKYKNVSVLPPQKRSKYLEFLASAKYAANPSVYEALSVFVLESLALGTPIFVTKPILKSIQTFIVDADSAPIKINRRELYLVKQSKVPSWDEIVEQIISNLYK
ncbi:MAG: glycosyltransferase family 4 protein [Leptospiraceae bacterium]|nr:glycosyltransferase family 4 protein [Leptospiraceae bacterium]